ncbi:MAG: LacI family DNA-binding transcriptional regulator [Chthoniobacterales bacterium]|nr:LacI family DNA-binding transcriptional regulator [Chthoniobacterales bacterium]
MNSHATERLSIRDIAARADCSVGSASKVLNGSDQVSAALRARVLKVVEETGYIPNGHARSLKSGRTGQFGLLMPFASDLYYATLLDAFNETVMDSSCRIEVKFHRWIESEGDDAIRYFVESGMEGLIINPWRVDYEKSSAIKLLEKRGIPYVMLGRQQNGHAPEVRQDLRRGTELLATHLISHGHRKIALLLPGTAKDHPAVQERIEGVKLAAARHSGTPVEIIELQNSRGNFPSARELREYGISMSGYQQNIQNLVDAFLHRKGGVTAAITLNQMTAWHLINALTEKGVRVPEDFSVGTLGLSNTDQYPGFPLTTAEYSPTEIASTVMSIFWKKTFRPAPVQPTLVIRRSSGPAQARVSSSQN